VAMSLEIKERRIKKETIKVKYCSYYLYAIISFILLSSGALADQDRKEKFTATIDVVIADEDLPGLQYVVVDSTGIIFEFAGGLKNIANESPVTRETAFMLNSSTKVFTAAATLQLIGKGKIKLDQSLSHYFPDHPYGKEITIQHLLNQTSGIPNPLPLKWFHTETLQENFNEDAELAKVLADNNTLSFTPGEEYEYTNISYWLLGKVIEKVSGESYCDYLRQFIFEPLAIKPDELSCVMPSENNLATGYQKKYSFLSLFMYFAGASQIYGDSENGFLSFKRVYHSGPAYGGLYGTSRGVAKFLIDLLSDKPELFNAKTKDLFFAGQKTNSGEPIAMTLGWRTGNIDGLPYYEKVGGGPGSHSNIRIYPSLKIATTYLANKTQVQESPISELSTLLDAPFIK